MKLEKILISLPIPFLKFQKFQHNDVNNDEKTKLKLPYFDFSWMVAMPFSDAKSP